MGPREHVRTRPEMYVGSARPEPAADWVVHGVAGGRPQLTHREQEIAPLWLKIADEVLVNASDNYLRGHGTKRIRVAVKVLSKPAGSGGVEVSVENDGRGIEIAKHPSTGKLYPSLVFGEFLTGSNFADDTGRSTGGRNGVGAKAANVWSSLFKVETGDGVFKFEQTWKDGMKEVGEPRVTRHSGSSFTRITFRPDFGAHSGSDPDAFYGFFAGAVRRRAAELAACFPEVEVVVDKEPLKVRSLRQFAELLCVGDTTVPKGAAGMLAAAEWESEDGLRWEAVVGPRLSCGEQLSFVNGINTLRGGTHLDAIRGNSARRGVMGQLLQLLRREHGISPREGFVEDHISILVACQVRHPSFNSQCKEILTEPSAGKLWQSAPCPESLFEQLGKLAQYLHDEYVAKKQEALALKHVSGGMPETLLDARLAGDKLRSRECRLVVVEGLSAKTMVVAGFKEVKRDTYGVLPLSGKIITAGKSDEERVLQSKAVAALAKALGIEPGKRYHARAERETLRYGSVVLLCDQDPDGSHIEGLVINLFHHLWPGLLHTDEPFLYRMETPLVKAIPTAGKAQQREFYSLPEYQKWKEKTDGAAQKWAVKYYKGLGTSSAEEGRHYFSNISKLIAPVQWSGPDCAGALTFAFGLRESQARRDRFGSPPAPRTVCPGKAVSVSEFIKHDFAEYAYLSNARAVPHVVDGLKEAQRKVLYACFRHPELRRADAEVKVVQLSGYAAEVTDYAHGEESMNGTIIRLAQRFPGCSKNVPLLEGVGQFGTRLQRGADHAGARYISVRLSPLARLLFPQGDDEHCPRGDAPEPLHYAPVLPLALLNGTTGLGTGWTATLLPREPGAVAAVVRDRIDRGRAIPEEELQDRLPPWYLGHSGDINRRGAEPNRWESCCANRLVQSQTSDHIRVRELPVQMSTEDYKHKTLSKHPGVVQWWEGSEATENVVDIWVQTTKALSSRCRTEPEHVAKTLKLTSSLHESRSHIDARGTVRGYGLSDVIEAHYGERLRVYTERREHLLRQANASCSEAVDMVTFLHWYLDGNGAERTAADLAQKLGSSERAQELLKRPCSELCSKHLHKWEKVKEERTEGLKKLKATVAVDLWQEDIDAFEEGYRKWKARS